MEHWFTPANLYLLSDNIASHYAFGKSAIDDRVTLGRPYGGAAILIKNKCTGDDTKAAARQSLNCIKNKNKMKYGEKRFSIWQMEFLHPSMWHDHDTDFAK